MFVCRVCKKEYHYCSKCNDTYMNNGFCSQSCFEKSDVYIKIKSFIQKLNNEERQLLYDYGDLIYLCT